MTRWKEEPMSRVFGFLFGLEHVTFVISGSPEQDRKKSEKKEEEDASLSSFCFLKPRGGEKDRSFFPSPAPSCCLFSDY